MLPAFPPPAGQTVLIEPQDIGHHAALGPVSGVVEASDDDGLAIAGVTPSQLPEGTEVVANIFAPEALYRIRAGAHWLTPERLTLDPIHDMERIQRRRWSRHEVHLDVTLSPQGGGEAAPGVKGRTLDIGMGGVRVETGSLLPAGADVRVILMLPDGAPLVARASVVGVEDRGDIFEYRLAFDGLDELDTTNLAALLDPQSVAADIRRKAATGRHRDH
ncbi:MAG: PilZ domain-containing protein [Actinomycetota bacterium]|nr:PilZ domain-containing protein [Actinomycetota bacterium]